MRFGVLPFQSAHKGLKISSQSSTGSLCSVEVILLPFGDEVSVAMALFKSERSRRMKDEMRRRLGVLADGSLPSAVREVGVCGADMENLAPRKYELRLDQARKSQRR